MRFDSVAEFIARYTGYTCQEVVHDYQKAFDATVKCCADFDWDATVPNMVYVWTGLTQAIGLNYYGVPGIDAIGIGANALGIIHVDGAAANNDFDG